MARVERYTAQGEVPVQQAQLISPGSFPADTSSAEALKVAADTANVFAELAIRRREAQDSLAATQASKSRTLAELKMQQFMVDNPDPNTWEEGYNKIYEGQAAGYSGLKQSAKAKKEQDIEQKAFKDQLQAKVRLAATNQDIKNDVFESGANVIDLMSTDDGSPQHALEETQAIERYKAALEREMTPEMAAIKMEETLKEGQKGFYQVQSRAFPDKTIALMEKKKKKVGGGKDEFGLNAKDFDDILASAYNAKALAKKSLDADQEEDRDELGQGLVDGTITYDKINATSLDEKEQEAYRLKMNAEAKRKAEDVPIAVDQRVKRELEGMAYDLTSGAVSMKEFKAVLDEARFPPKDNPVIDDDTYDSLISLAEGKFASYQDKAMKERETYALTQLVTLPNEEAFAEMLARLTSRFDKEQAQTLRQLQFDNLDQYKHALRTLRKDHPEWTADEIYTEGRSLLTQYRKTPDELRGITVRKPRPASELPPLSILGKTKFGETPKSVIDNYPAPKTIDEFLNTFHSITDKKQKKLWYDKWSDKVYKVK